MKTKSISIRVRSELFDEVAKIADRDERTMNQQINLFIKLGLERYEARQKAADDFENRDCDPYPPNSTQEIM